MTQGIIEFSRGPAPVTKVNRLVIELPFPSSLEIWKDILGYEGYYQVSNFGRVRSLTRSEVIPYLETTRVRKRNGRICAPRFNRHYFQITLSRDGRKEQPPIHRLVAQAFIPNPDGKPQVNHIDGNKTNNAWTNLEWCTAQENAQHAIIVLGIDKSGGRQKTCKAITARNSAETLVFDSIRHAERAGFVRHMIKACLRGTYSQHRGYIWTDV